MTLDAPVALWHDRAVFHFLTDPADRARYRDVMYGALARDGHVIIATFAEDGPEQCSGLPVVRYSPEKLSATLGAELTLVETWDEEHQTPAGRARSASSSVASRARPAEKCRAALARYARGATGGSRRDPRRGGGGR